jgi:hypothetical protein
LDATVQDIRVNENTGVRELGVHYNGWPERWDEYISVESCRISLFRTKTKNCGNAGRVQQGICIAASDGTRDVGLERFEDVWNEVRRVYSDVKTLIDGRSGGRGGRWEEEKEKDVEEEKEDAEEEKEEEKEEEEEGKEDETVVDNDGEYDDEEEDEETDDFDISIQNARDSMDQSHTNTLPSLPWLPYHTSNNSAPPPLELATVLDRLGHVLIDTARAMRGIEENNIMDAEIQAENDAEIEEVVEDEVVDDDDDDNDDDDDAATDDDALKKNDIPVENTVEDANDDIDDNASTASSTSSYDLFSPPNPPNSNANIPSSSMLYGNNLNNANAAQDLTGLINTQPPQASLLSSLLTTPSASGLLASYLLLGGGGEGTDIRIHAIVTSRIDRLANQAGAAASAAAAEETEQPRSSERRWPPIIGRRGEDDIEVVHDEFDDASNEEQEGLYDGSPVGSPITRMMLRRGDRDRSGENDVSNDVSNDNGTNYFFAGGDERYSDDPVEEFGESAVEEVVDEDLSDDEDKKMPARRIDGEDSEEKMSRAEERDAGGGGGGGGGGGEGGMLINPPVCERVVAPRLLGSVGGGGSSAGEGYAIAAAGSRGVSEQQFDYASKKKRAASGGAAGYAAAGSSAAPEMEGGKEKSVDKKEAKGKSVGILAKLFKRTLGRKEGGTSSAAKGGSAKRKS